MRCRPTPGYLESRVLRSTLPNVHIISLFVKWVLHARHLRLRSGLPYRCRHRRCCCHSSAPPRGLSPRTSFRPFRGTGRRRCQSSLRLSKAHQSSSVFLEDSPRCFLKFIRTLTVHRLQGILIKTLYEYF